jgi:hypothetical protein
MQTGMPARQDENLEHKKFLNSSKGTGGFKVNAANNTIIYAQNPLNHYGSNQKFQSIPENDGTMGGTIS